MAKRAKRRRAKAETWAPAAKNPRVSPYELFYDLVFAAAILGLSLQFGRTQVWSAIGVAAVTFTFAWWVWQETVLFTNRFGDPLRPIPTDASRRVALLTLVGRWACLLQMIAVIMIALFEPAGLRAADLEGTFAFASAGALAALALLREVGAALRPELRSTIAKRRPWEILAIALFCLEGALHGSGDGYLWFAGLIATVVPGLIFETRESANDGRREAQHLSERLMLFFLIISGDLFLKVIVYWNGDFASDLNPLQLVFVSAIIFSIFRLYVSRVGSRLVPKGGWRFSGWILLHLILCFAVLMAAGGMIEYVIPKGELSRWALRGGAWSIALALACIAALDRIGGGPTLTRRAWELAAVALSIGVSGLVVFEATPYSWRIGMGVIAAILVTYTTQAIWRTGAPLTSRR